MNDIELEDLENYQARRQPVCAKCGRVRPLPGQILFNRVEDTLGNLLPEPARGFAGALIPQEVADREAGRPDDGGPDGPRRPGGRRRRPGGPAGGGGGTAAEPTRYDGGPCPWCGSEEWTSKEQEYEQVMLPIQTAGGVTVEGATPGLDEQGRPVMKPTLVPFYRPDLYPIILQRSVSVYGQLLGNSDVDQIREPAEHGQPHGAEDPSTAW